MREWGGGGGDGQITTSSADVSYLFNVSDIYSYLFIFYLVCWLTHIVYLIS